MALEFTKLVNGTKLDEIQGQVDDLDSRVSINETDISDIKTQLDNLPSGGGGSGASITTDVFGGVSLSANYDNIYNLFLNDKILYMTVEVTSEISYQKYRYMSKHETFNDTYSVGTIFKCVPSKKQSNGLFFSTSDGFSQAGFWLKPTGELSLCIQTVYVDSSSTHYSMYSTVSIPLSSVTIKVSHF